MKSPENRAVITGMGVIAPNGNSLETFWHNTLACRSGVAKISRFPTENYPVTVAAEVKDFDIRDHLPPEGKVRFRRLSLQTRYGIAAAHEAVRHAGLQAADFDARPPVDIVVGVSSNALEMIEHATEVMRKKGPGKIIPYGVSACQPHAVACGIMDTLRIQGSRRTFSSACPAGLNALGEALERIRDGASDLVICGGVDAPITPLMMASMHLEGLALEMEMPPEQVSRPFDAKRMGGIIGEGAAMFVVESLAHALDRGATPLAEISGHGIHADCGDNGHGSGLPDAMRHALDDAGMLPGDIHYINAHGPSHPVLDEMETSAIKEVFREQAYRLPVSSIKGVIGNPLAAAGPMQVAASVMAIRTGQIPPTANYEHPDPACDLQYVPNTPLSLRIDRLLVNLHGLGGGNSCLVLERMEDRG